MTNHAHILLRSSSAGLTTFMRRFLSGYAIMYNRRHRRYGRLFQNRYKSIVCEEDPYFKELVRYIHLNPLRAGMVKTLAKLDRYKWCGHGVIMNRYKNEWQDRRYVLKWFGRKEGDAKKSYKEFVEKGIALLTPGFTPDTLGQIYVYRPSLIEIKVAVMIMSIGFLIFTLLTKIAIAINFEGFNIDTLKRKKATST